MKHFLLLFTIFALLHGDTSLFGGIENACPYPNLSMSAKGQIQKPADAFYLKISVVNTDEKAKKTLRENNEIITTIIDALKTVGLSDEEYQTGFFTIQPTYTPIPKDPPSDWKSTINGYQVTNTLIIQSKKLDLAAPSIDAANRSGATSIDELRFILADPEQYFHEAIEKATNIALNNASVMAKSANVTLGRLLWISLDNPTQEPLYRITNFAKDMDIGSLLPLAPGNVTLSATVHVIYEISGG